VMHKDEWSNRKMTLSAPKSVQPATPDGIGRNRSYRPHVLIPSPVYPANGSLLAALCLINKLPAGTEIGGQKPPEAAGSSRRRRLLYADFGTGR
jgi:hypothetical protein